MYLLPMIEKIDRTAKAYKALGIKEGETVTICMPNAPQGVDSFYALNRIGAVPAMIHPLSARVPTVLSYHSTGISTCCPSATTLVLTLGPDLPRADQLYPGNLGYSATRIPTSFSLLIPAFSLLNSPLLLPVQLRPVKNAPLPIDVHQFLSFGSVFQPRTFSAQDLSTSELLRTLLMDGCF